MTEAQDQAFVDVEGALLADADDDVQTVADGFTVKGALFATRTSEGDLVVDLPADRARDLIDRDVAAEFHGDRPAKGTWVVIADTEDWIEMATEAHQFVGEPAVGRDS